MQPISMDASGHDARVVEVSKARNRKAAMLLLVSPCIKVEVVISAGSGDDVVVPKEGQARKKPKIEEQYDEALWSSYKTYCGVNRLNFDAARLEQLNM